MIRCPSLWAASLRYLRLHPWQLALSLTGIALGVAVVLAVDLANGSASKAFELSAEALTGKTTHRIVAGPKGVPQAAYVALKGRPDGPPAAPVITGRAALATDPRERLEVLGIDPFAEGPFRTLLSGAAATDVDLSALVTRPNTVVLSGAAARRLGVGRGDTLDLLVGPRPQRVTVIGLAGDPQNTATDGLVITDIATAQVLLDLSGHLSRIDLILDSTESAAALERSLPPGLRLVDARQENAATTQLGAAFRLNLTAMSLLAMLVGMFLIFNAMSFSVVQRRELIGRLRAVGVTEGEVFRLILGEALLIGLVGTAAGSLLGIWLGQFLVTLVARTINDLYFAVSVTHVHLSGLSLAKGAVLGLAATLAAAWLPAREAAHAAPLSSLVRIQIESRIWAVLPWLASAGGALLTLGLIVALWVPGGVIVGFLGLFGLIVGVALLVPWLVVVLVRAGRMLRAPLVLRMALRDVERNLSRLGVAVAALTVALAATVGVGVMVDSFRQAVTVWLDGLLNADIYVAAESHVTGDAAARLDPRVIAVLQADPRVAALSLYRHREIVVGGQPSILVATALALASRAGYRFAEGDPQEAWRAFDRPDTVLVSQPLAYRLGVGAGDTVALPIAAGPRAFHIAGVFFDYGTEQGRVLISLPDYRRHWQDEAINTAAVFARDDPDALRRDLAQMLDTIQPVSLQASGKIRSLSLEIFDRTFLITQVLRLLVVLVAFVGVISALMALQLQRAREFAVLRAVGLTRWGLGGLIGTQSVLLGLMAGLLSIPAGSIMGGVLIFSIQRRSFGWTMPFQADPLVAAQALALAMVAALLASLYPALRAAFTTPASALRGE